MLAGLAPARRRLVVVTVQSVCDRAQVSHGQLPTIPLVQQMVLRELAAGPPVALGAADCARLSR